MAYRGHWLFNLLCQLKRSDGEFITPGSAKTYWYQPLYPGLADDGVSFDPDRLKSAIEADSTPPAAALRVVNFLNTYPQYDTPELRAVAEATYTPKARKAVREGKPEKPLLTRDEMFEKLADFDSQLVPHAPYVGKRKSPPLDAFTCWVILRLSLNDFPLRNGELVSIRINDPDAQNNLDTFTGRLTIREHKTAHHAKAPRVYDMPEFAKEWLAQAKRVFETAPGYLLGAKMTANRLSTFATKHGLGSQRMRPSVAVAYKDAPFEELLRVARNSGHDTRTQAKTYILDRLT